MVTKPTVSVSLFLPNDEGAVRHPGFVSVSSILLSIPARDNF